MHTNDTCSYFSSRNILPQKGKLLKARRVAPGLFEWSTSSLLLDEIFLRPHLPFGHQLAATGNHLSLLRDSHTAILGVRPCHLRRGVPQVEETTEDADGDHQHAKLLQHIHDNTRSNPRELIYLQ